MKKVLRMRIARAIGNTHVTNPHDSPKRVLQDCYTELKRAEERVDSLEEFVAFVKGFSSDHGDNLHLIAIAKRLADLEK